MILLSFFATALAQEPEVSEEVIVSERVEAARQAVIDELVNLGFDRVKDQGDRVVLKHSTTWKGKILLYDDGYLRHRRQGLRVVEGPAVGLPDGTRWLPCIIVPTACFEFGATVSDAKFSAVEARTLAEIEPELRTLGDRLADAALAANLEALPEGLEALWADGDPLVPGEQTLETYRERRAAILAFWESRTETPWGEAIRGATESFVRGVVQPSDHPFTAAEVARFNEQTSASRPFEVASGP